MKKEFDLKLDVWMYVIANINDTYPSKLSKDLDITYSHIHKICMKLNGLRLLNKEKVGRKVYFTLTKKGKEVAEQCQRLIEFVQKAEKFNGSNW